MQVDADDGEIVTPDAVSSGQRGAHMTSAAANKRGRRYYEYLEPGTAAQEPRQTACNRKKRDARVNINLLACLYALDRVCHLTSHEKNI